VQRFVILVDYRLTNVKIISDVNITVIKLRKPISLPWAWHLARDQNYGRHFTPCDLLDRNGIAIPTNNIVHVGSFQGYWIHAGDDELDKPPVRPIREPARQQLNAIRAVPRLREEQSIVFN
jgi:hypothetical protein